MEKGYCIFKKLGSDGKILKKNFSTNKLMLFIERESKFYFNINFSLLDF